MQMRKLPIGIQSFEKIRTDQFLYIDKTAYIYRLVHDNIPYFLSRPRRFGKSLLLSTLKAYWEGRRDLFEGLYIQQMEEGNPDAWASFPVFYFDFNGVDYHVEGALEKALDGFLGRWEREYGIIDRENSRTLEERFSSLLRRTHVSRNRRCVVLVDEYDKPLLDLSEDKGLLEHNKEIFKAFFGILKSEDEHIQFVFLTGVTKFHKVSIFSDINQLTDISLEKDYATLCGITEEELNTNLQVHLAAMSQKCHLSVEECLQRLRRQYDGYRFHPWGVSVYNPFSLLTALRKGEFGSYWFETGTPSFLIKKLRRSHFEMNRFTDRTLYASEKVLTDYTGDEGNPIPLLYQTGYLTIIDYDMKRGRYTLGVPNEEVKYGLIESLVPSYVPAARSGNGLDIFTLEEYMENGQLDRIRDFLTALFASITYTREDDPFENYFQAVIYLIFTLLGKLVQCEVHTFSGRIDCKVETTKFIYLFEFKRDASAKTALAQIDTKEYALPYQASARTIYKIGVSFDSRTRKLDGWEVSQ